MLHKNWLYTLCHTMTDYTRSVTELTPVLLFFFSLSAVTHESRFSPSIRGFRDSFTDIYTKPGTKRSKQQPWGPPFLLLHQLYALLPQKKKLHNQSRQILLPHLYFMPTKSILANNRKHQEKCRHQKVYKYNVNAVTLRCMVSSYELLASHCICLNLACYGFQTAQGRFYLSALVRALVLNLSIVLTGRQLQSCSGGWLCCFLIIHFRNKRDEETVSMY